MMGNAEDTDGAERQRGMFTDSEMVVGAVHVARTPYRDTLLGALRTAPANITFMHLKIQHILLSRLCTTYMEVI